MKTGAKKQTISQLPHSGIVNTLLFPFLESCYYRNLHPCSWKHIESKLMFSQEKWTSLTLGKCQRWQYWPCRQHWLSWPRWQGWPGGQESPASQGGWGDGSVWTRRTTAARFYKTLPSSRLVCDFVVQGISMHTRMNWFTWNIKFECLITYFFVCGFLFRIISDFRYITGNCFEYQTVDIE